MILAVPATSEAVRKVYGAAPARSMRGVAFERDGQVLGCAGFYLEKTYAVMFFDGDHEAMKTDLRAVVESGRAILEIAKAKGLPIFADAAETIDGSERLLEFFGFKRVSGSVFQWAP